MGIVDVRDVNTMFSKTSASKGGLDFEHCHNSVEVVGETVQDLNNRILIEMEKLGKLRKDDEYVVDKFEGGVKYYEDDAYSGRTITYSFNEYYKDCLTETVSSDSPEQCGGWNIISMYYKNKWYILNNIADRACPIIYNDRVYLCELNECSFNDYNLTLIPAMYVGEENRYEVGERCYKLDSYELRRLINIKSTRAFIEEIITIVTEIYNDMHIRVLKDLSAELND